VWIGPLLSQTIILSFEAPKLTSRSRQVSDAAPTVGNDPHVFDQLADKGQGVQDARCGNYGRAVLIVANGRVCIFPAGPREW
jgi:hypothetical protein